MHQQPLLITGDGSETRDWTYVDDIVRALSKDPNKQVRRIAAMALGNMAEAIPLEAQHAIPALTDALHDEYILVRKFADKALGLIREAIRKAESQ